jgi:hypothetical protein
MRIRIWRFLAVPNAQLLLSSACAIVLAMKASPTAVFPHRGLVPHQFTPMSGAHKSLERTEMSRSAHWQGNIKNRPLFRPLFRFASAFDGDAKLP